MFKYCFFLRLYHHFVIVSRSALCIHPVFDTELLKDISDFWTLWEKAKV